MLYYLIQYLVPITQKKDSLLKSTARFSPDVHHAKKITPEIGKDIQFPTEEIKYIHHISPKQEESDFKKLAYSTFHKMIIVPI